MAKFLVNPITGNLDLSLNKAAEIKYDNTTSGLTAVNTQAAIDELDGIINALPTPLTYKGTWNAATNTPTLSNSDTGVEGFLYRVNAAGSVNFGAGAIAFEIGDNVVNNGTIWEKWDHSDQVESVNGQTGAVVLDTDDISEGSNLYFTDERARDAAGAMATSSAKVSLTYNDGADTLTPDIVADSLVNADINSAAAIAYSKLNLANSIVDADVAAAAAIARSKLAAGTANRLAYNASPGGALSDLAAITASRALESDSNGLPVASAVTATELSYVSGVTSSIQTQLDSKTGANVLSSQNTNFTAASNFTYLVDSSGGAIVITLPAPSLGAQFIVKDAGGAASTNSITLDPAGADLIDGQASYILTSDYGSVQLISNGTNWFLI